VSFVILIFVCPFYTMLFLLHLVFLRHRLSCSSEPFICVPSKSKIGLVDTGLYRHGESVSKKIPAAVCRRRWTNLQCVLALERRNISSLWSFLGLLGS
jgi:hypothetical protein